MKKRVKKEEVIVIHPINTASARSIEEMAKLGMPFSILAKAQQAWLIRGGLEYIKREKPYLYPLVEKMMENKDEAFPEEGTLLELAREVVNRLGWEGSKIMSVTSWVEKIVRWKLEPFHQKSKKARTIARTLKEILEERYRESPRKYKYLYKSVSEWVRWNEKAMEIMGEEDELG